MNHPDRNNTLLDQIVNHILQEGAEGLAETVRLLLNQDMEVERSKALGACSRGWGAVSVVVRQGTSFFPMDLLAKQFSLA